MKLKPYLLLLTIMLLVNQFLIAQTFEVEGIAYNITSDIEPYTVEISSNTPDYSGEITIPNQVLFADILYAVTSIGDYSFSGSSELTGITMPNTILSIGSWAFSDCSSLESLVFSNSLVTINDFSFNRCLSVSQFDFPVSLDTIGSSVFTHCSGLETFEVPENVRFLGDFRLNRQNGC